MRRSELAAAGSYRRDIPGQIGGVAPSDKIICPLRSRRGNSDLMIAHALPPARSTRATSSLSPVSSHRHPPTRSLIRNPAPLTEPK